MLGYHFKKCAELWPG